GSLRQSLCGRNLEAIKHSARIERQLGGSIHGHRRDVPEHSGATACACWHCHPWPIFLAPKRPKQRTVAFAQVPSDPNPAVGNGESAVFECISGKLMQGKPDVLGGKGREYHTGADKD